MLNFYWMCNIYDPNFQLDIAISDGMFYSNIWG